MCLGMARLARLDGPSRRHKLHAGRDHHRVFPLRRLPPSCSPTTASFSRRPSTRPSLVCAATHRPHGSSPTARRTCRKRRTSTTYQHNKPTTACRQSQTSSQSPSEQHGTTTTTAARVTPRTPMCSRQCPRPASRPITSSRSPQHRGPASTSLPRKQLHRCLEAVRISCHASSTTAATSHPRRPRQCRTRLAHQHTRRMLTCTAVAATGDVAVTNTNKTTAHHHLDDRHLALGHLEPAVTRQKHSKRRKTSSLDSVQELGTCSTRNTGFGSILIWYSMIPSNLRRNVE